MWITITFAGVLLERAREVTRLAETNAVIRAGLIVLVEWQSSTQLARLGGTEPHRASIPRWRSGQLGTPGA